MSLKAAFRAACSSTRVFGDKTLAIAILVLGLGAPERAAAHDDAFTLSFVEALEELKPGLEALKLAYDVAAGSGEPRKEPAEIREALAAEIAQRPGLSAARRAALAELAARAEDVDLATAEQFSQYLAAQPPTPLERDEIVELGARLGPSAFTTLEQSIELQTKKNEVWLRSNQDESRLELFVAERTAPGIVGLATAFIGVVALGVALFRKTSFLLEKHAEPPEQISFSRVVGAVGAIGFAAFFVGLSAWVLLRIPEDQDAVQKATEGLSYFFFAAAAFFFPYAANQLATVWRQNTDPS